MLLRTHLVIGVAVALYFLPFVDNGLTFVAFTILASVLPDIDSRFSIVGKRIIFRPVQAMTKHRGILHTYTFVVVISIILAFFYPILALPVFMGWSFHLLADSFTKRGITPFWPFKRKSSGFITTGGTADKALFFAFIVIDVILIVMTIAQNI